MQCLVFVSIAVVLGFVAAIPFKEVNVSEEQEESGETIVPCEDQELMKSDLLSCAITAVPNIINCFKPANSTVDSDEKYWTSRKIQTADFPKKCFTAVLMDFLKCLLNPFN